jgi:hypothetical protein
MKIGVGVDGVGFFLGSTPVVFWGWGGCGKIFWAGGRCVPFF